MGNHQTQFVCVGEVLGGSVDTAGMVSYDAVDVLGTISSVTQFGRTCLKTCNAKVWCGSPVATELCTQLHARSV